MAIFTVSLASPPNGKVGGVLLRTVLHRHHSERFFECYPCLPSRAACMLHDKQILLKNEVLSIYDKYQELKKEVQPYLDAVKLAPEKVRAFLDAILTRTRQTRQHDQPSRRKSQDIEL